MNSVFVAAADPHEERGPQTLRVSLMYSTLTKVRENVSYSTLRKKRSWLRMPLCASPTLDMNLRSKCWG